MHVTEGDFRVMGTARVDDLGGSEHGSRWGCGRRLLSTSRPNEQDLLCVQARPASPPRPCALSHPFFSSRSRKVVCTLIKITDSSDANPPSSDATASPRSALLVQRRDAPLTARTPPAIRRPLQKVLFCRKGAHATRAGALSVSYHGLRANHGRRTQEEEEGMSHTSVSRVFS